MMIFNKLKINFNLLNAEVKEIVFILHFAFLWVNKIIINNLYHLFNWNRLQLRLIFIYKINGQWTCTT